MCFNMRFPACQKPTETVILFQNTEHAFHLYRAVHSQKNTFLTDDVGKRFFSVFHKFRRYFDLSKSSLRFVALSTMRTTGTTVVPVISCFNFVSRSRMFRFAVCIMQNISVRTQITVTFFVVSHIFHTVRIGFVFPRFTDLVILRFDEALLSVFFQIQIVFFTLLFHFISSWFSLFTDNISFNRYSVFLLYLKDFAIL